MYHDNVAPATSIVDTQGNKDSINKDLGYLDKLHQPSPAWIYALLTLESTWDLPHV